MIFEYGERVKIIHEEWVRIDEIIDILYTSDGKPLFMLTDGCTLFKENGEIYSGGYEILKVEKMRNKLIFKMEGCKEC